MVRKRSLVTITIISLFALMIITPNFVLGAKRSEVLVDFILGNQNDQDKAFGDTNDKDITPLATMASVHILNVLNELENFDVSTETTLNSWILDEIDNAIQVENIQNLAYLLETLDEMDKISDLSESKVEEIKTTLENLKDVHGGMTGYGITQEDDITLFGTYFAIKCYMHLGLIDEVGGPIIDIVDDISSYIASCYNATVGGYKTNTSDSYTTISLINTFYATKTIDNLGIDSTIEEYKSNISDYIESFYVDDVNLKSHYGGYSFYPEDEVPFSTFVATYYAMMSLKAIYSATTVSDETEKWILNHQNPEDGGFIENNELTGDIVSSALTSYYAVKILEIDSSNLEELNVEAWGFSIQWALIISITVLIIVCIIAAIVYYRRKTAL